MSGSRFDRSNIKHEIKERDRIYKEMTDLSIRAMGPGRFGDDAKNEDQILKVISSLEDIQFFREGLESPMPDDDIVNLDLGEIEFTKAILEERAQEFKERAKVCLASYDVSSRPVVLEHLKTMQRLYDVSYARANELLGQKAQALQANQQHRNRATRVSSEVTRRDFEKLEAGLNASIGEHVKSLTIELNDGTPSTPGQHIRISGGHDVQTALKNAIQAVGLTIEEKAKGSTPIVVVRLTKPFDSTLLVKIRENFQREMRQISSAIPNIKSDIEERDSLLRDLLELSIKTMGVNEVNEAKNAEQIFYVAKAIIEMQRLGEGLESPTSTDNLNLETILLRKKVLEGRALEFKQTLQDCLSSYSSSSQAIAAKHLKKMQDLYDSSNTVVNETLDQKAQSLRIGAAHITSSSTPEPLLERRTREPVKMKKPAGMNAGVHRLSQAEEYRNYLQRIVVGFKMHPEFTSEINAGTESTPGNHLRFSAHPGAHYELTALKTALDETGISYEEKVKGVDGEERMLIIRQTPNLGPDFEAKFKQHYVAALKKIVAEAKATRASQARNPQQLKHEEAAREISRDIQVSYDELDELAKKYEGHISIDNTPVKLTSIDELFYLMDDLLDQVDAGIDNMKRLKENLQTELALSGIPVSQQEDMLQSAQNKIQEIEALSIEAHSGIEPTKRSLTEAYNIPPLPVKDQTERLKRQQTKEPDSAAEASEKIELLAEIKRIKGQIHNMTENLTNEIPKAMFSQGLKTHKRNTLLSLSRTLYVSEKSSLAELRACAEKFGTELKLCQGDAILRQGGMRKNCRALIDNLAKDLESEQHVFKRPK